MRWRFPEIGVPLNHYFFNNFHRIFHEINPPAIGVPPFMETPMSRKVNPGMLFFDAARRPPRRPRALPDLGDGSKPILYNFLGDKRPSRTMK